MTANVDNPTGSTSARRQEAALALPSRRLLIGVAIACAAVAAGWTVVALAGSLGGPVMVSGLAGTLAVGMVAMLGVLIMSPWKQRAVADWMTMWLAATVFRLIATPIVVYLVYSAASSAMAVKPLALSVAATYLLTLVAEAAILASHVRRSFPSV